MRILLLGLVVVVVAPGWADDPPAEKARPPFQRLLQGEDAKTAQALEERIADLEGKDDYPPAVKVAEELTALRARVQGEDHWEVRDARLQVSRLRTVGALPLDQRQQVRDASAAMNRAVDLYSKGKYVDAQPLFEKVLAIRRQAFGEDHPDTAEGYGNLAANLDAQGKYADGQPLFEKALAISRQALGEDHPDTAQGYNNLAYNLNGQGRYAEAQPLYEKALAIRRQALGDEHAITGSSYNNLAFNLNSQGKYAEAQPLYEKALDIWRHSLGEEHSSTAIGYNNLALNLNAQGRNAEAQPLFEKALTIFRQALGEEHPDTAAGYNGLANNLHAQGKYAEAQPLYEKALDIRRKARGDEHPDTAAGYTGLANNLYAQGKYAEAQPLYEKALTITRKAHGEDHPFTATGYYNVALNLNDQGKYADAQPLYEKALAIRRKALGEEHPDTARGYHNLGLNLHAQGRYADAQLMYEKALAIRRQALGDEHPDTARGYHNLAANLSAQGKDREALTVLHRATRSYECSRLTGAHGLERSVASGEKSPYPLQATVLARLGRSKDAWKALEYDLARGLLDQLADRDLRGLRPQEQQQHGLLTQRLNAISTRVLYLLTRLERSKAEQKELDDLASERRELETKLADLATTVSQREVASLDALQKALPADTALLAWLDVTSAGSEDHWACVVRSTGDPVWQRMPGTGPDKQWNPKDRDLPERLLLAVTGNRTLAPASTAEVAALASALHAQRLSPLDKHLQGVKTLFIVPVRGMSGLPVEVSSDRYRISYVPSGTFLARLGDHPGPSGQRVLAVGDPRFEAAAPRPTPAPLPPGGVHVKHVVPNGNAATALIASGDVLLTYGGTDLKDVEQLRKLLVDKASEKTVAVTVWRDGKTGVKQLVGGKLGAVLDEIPASQVIAARNQADNLLAAVRGGDWKELPGTRLELARLTALFGKEQVTVLADVRATKPALEDLRTADRLKEFRYLHFATHGEANSVSAFQSQLILVQDKAAREALPRAGQPTLDGKLTALEVLKFWKLDADLVTLSACETALGRKGGGDGQLGFAQAFLTAGSRSVCLSLWKVDDNATALLMDRFYQNLKARMGKAEALAEAKQWLRNLSLEEATQRLGAISNGVARGEVQEALKVEPPVADPKADPKEVKPFAHPRYWAAFILIGDPN
jgi:tetratricopeptide (TPR) repeat protein